MHPTMGCGYMYILGKSYTTDLYYDIKHEVLHIVVFYYYDSVPLDAIPWTINAQSSDHDEIETKEHNFDIDVAIHSHHLPHMKS